MPSSDRTEHPAASVQDETAAWAFADALLALRELGHADVAARLRARWPEVDVRADEAQPMPP